MRNKKKRDRMVLGGKQSFLCYLGGILIVLLLVGSCATTSPKEPLPTYQRDAVSMTLTASDQVNLYGGLPHATVLCVYQLSNPGVFQQMLEELEGVNRLLSCQSFDASVKSRRRLVVQPGEKKVVVMDRAEGARYLGVIAGYYKRMPGSFSRLIPFPIVETGTFKKEKALGQIYLNMELGPEGIVKP